MRFHVVASFVVATSAAAIITAIPLVGRAQGEPAPAAPPAAPTPSPRAPAAGAGAANDAEASAPDSTPAPAVSPTADPAPAGTAAAAAPSSDGRGDIAPAGKPTAAPAPPSRMVASLSHELQFGVAVLLGGGYRGIYPYHSTINCGDAKSNDNRLCTNRAPFFLDLQPSFGLSSNWDFVVDLRFGIERDFNTYRQLYVMPGFRFWLDSQSTVKFFTTVQLAYDRSKQNSPMGAPHPVGDTDLGFRNSNGIMVEVMRNFGAYFQFGETIGFYRWVSMVVDAGIGVQARVP